MRSAIIKASRFLIAALTIAILSGWDWPWEKSISGEYTTISRHLWVSTWHWDFRSDRTVILTISQTGHSDPSRDESTKDYGSYTIAGRTLTAHFDDIKFPYVFQIEANGDLIQQNGERL